jgi:hypothetical protein
VNTGALWLLAGILAATPARAASGAHQIAENEPNLPAATETLRILAGSPQRPELAMRRLSFAGYASLAAAAAWVVLAYGAAIMR